MTEEETILGVSLSLIKSRRNLLGTWRHFGKDKGMLCQTRQQFDALGITDLEMAEYIRMGKSIKERDTQLKQADEMRTHQEYTTFVEEREERIAKANKERDAKLQEYLKSFEAPTDIDIDNLKITAGIVLAIEYNQQSQMAYMGKTDPASVQAKAVLSTEITNLTRELRQLEKDMGIDLPTRIKAESQATGIDVVRDIVEGTREHYDKYGIAVEHCHILIADLLNYFPEMGYDYRTICPRCKETIHIHEEKEDDMSKMWGQVGAGDGGDSLPELWMEGDDT